MDGKPRAHIPYRDSPLTRLLRPALGGPAQTALIACVTPAADSESETSSTLGFAARATYIRNKEDEEDETALPEAEASKIEAKGNVPAISDGMTVIPACGLDVSCCAEWSSGPLVVFLHHYGFGATGNWWSWLFTDVVSSGGCYLSPSFPGHGQTAGSSSSKAEDLGKPSGPVAILKAMLDWVGAAKVILVGFDWGAGIAAEFAVLYPRRVKKLALYSMSYRDEAKLAKLSKRGKEDVCFMWEKDDPNRSYKKGKQFAKILDTKYNEFDMDLLQKRLRKWVSA
jgi:pimeloyl-ACP methyl ester carboxylesterase